MTFDAIYVLAVVAAALVLFAMDRIRLDQLCMSVPVVLLLGGVLTPKEAFSGLASEATVTVAAMLVLGLGLKKTGLVDEIGHWAQTARLGGQRTRLFVLCLVVAALSPFLNNTAVVIVFIPVFIALAKQAGEPPSVYLMPLSFVAIMGGTVTLIGTATNLIVVGTTSDMMADAAARGESLFNAEYEPLGMFSIAPLGLICLGVGMLYMFTLGRRLLPRREQPPDLSSKYGVRRFVTELSVTSDSLACDKSLADLRWGERYGVNIVGIQRDGRSIEDPSGPQVVEAGDVLLAQGGASELLGLAERERLDNPGTAAPTAAAPVREGQMVEVIVGPGSALVGRTLAELSFAQRYDATVLGVQHQGASVTDALAIRRFEVGDILLLKGESFALQRMADEPGLIPMSEVESDQTGRPGGKLAGAIMLAVVAAAGFGLAPISTAAMAGVALMIFTRCVRVTEIYDEMDWLVVFVMAGLIPLGLAMEQTGAAAWIAGGVVNATSGLGEAGMIAAFYVLTATMTAVVANTATAVMLTPVAISVAASAGLNPNALLVAVMFAASASFVTPFGYKTNVMIYSPGGYSFSDFIKVGGPLNLLLAAVAALLIPFFWPSP